MFSKLVAFLKSGKAAAEAKAAVAKVEAEGAKLAADVKAQVQALVAKVDALAAKAKGDVDDVNKDVNG